MPKESPAVIDFAHQDPRYLEAWGKLQEIRGHIDRIDRAVEAECARIAETRNPSRTLEAAHALVYGHEASTPSGPCADLKKLHDERQVYVAAVSIAEHRVHEVEKQVSREVIARVLPDYVALVERQEAAAAELVAAAEEEDRFIRRLMDGGTRLGVLQRVTWPRADAETLKRFREEASYHHGLKF